MAQASAALARARFWWGRCGSARYLCARNRKVRATSCMEGVLLVGAFAGGSVLPAEMAGAMWGCAGTLVRVSGCPHTPATAPRCGCGVSWGRSHHQSIPGGRSAGQGFWPLVREKAETSSLGHITEPVRASPSGWPQIIRPTALVGMRRMFHRQAAPQTSWSAMTSSLPASGSAGHRRPAGAGLQDAP